MNCNSEEHSDSKENESDELTPVYFFLDTNVFDQYKYNYDSEVLRSLKEIVSQKHLIHLLPDPIMREVKRHLEERASECAERLEKVAREAPFVRMASFWYSLKIDWKDKLDGCGMFLGTEYPLPDLDTVPDPLLYAPIQQHPIWDGDRVKSELKHLAALDLQIYLAALNTELLDYSNVSISNIMDSYSNCEPPFGPGLKRKEFPDALALASLKAFAQENEQIVAVISADEDMKKACEYSSRLVHYAYLPDFIEIYMKQDSKLLKALNLIDTVEPPNMLEAINKAVETLHHHFLYEASEGSFLAHAFVDDVLLTKRSIIAIGTTSFLCAFRAAIKLELLIEVPIKEDSSSYSTRGYSDYARTSVSGVMKVTTDSNYMHIGQISTITLDEVAIAIIPMERDWEEEKYIGD